MARRHLIDPEKRIPAENAAYARLPKPLWGALEAYRAETKSTRSNAIRSLLAEALRTTGHLPRLKAPEDATWLEDVHDFPWPPRPGTTRQPTRLPWFSNDPSVLTWATLLRAMEHETQTRAIDVAARHGMSSIHAYRIFRRFDLWRRGEDHRPRLDPFTGPRKGATKGATKRRKTKHAKTG